MRNFDKNFKFTIYKNFTLSSEDYEILSFLYLPIIKKDAYCLYLSLYDLNSYEKDTLYVDGDMYFKRIGFDSSSVLLDAVRHLEGINLLTTYKRNKINSANELVSSYLFKLSSPASAYKFFNDQILRSLLVNEITEKEYLNLKRYFSINSPLNIDDNFINISSEFKEVYKLPSAYNDSILSDDFSNKHYTKENLFTEDELLGELSKNMIDSSIIEKHIEDIIALSSLYSIDLKSTINIIINNISTDNKFYFEKFKHDFQQFNHYKSLSTMTNKRNNDVTYLKYIKNYEQYKSVEDFLASKQNKKPSKNQLDTISDLKLEYKFSNTIIEIIIDYSLNHTSNSFNNEYIIKVADTLKLNNITTAYDAMEFLTNWDSNYKKKKKKINTKKNAGIEMVDLKEDKEDELEKVNSLL